MTPIKLPLDALLGSTGRDPALLKPVAPRPAPLDEHGAAATLPAEATRLTS